MSDYKLATDDVRNNHRAGIPNSQTSDSDGLFDCWLAAHDAEVAAKVLDRAVDRVLVSDWWGYGVINEHGNVAPAVREWLSERAAEYRKTTESETNHE